MTKKEINFIDDVLKKTRLPFPKQVSKVVKPKKGKGSSYKRNKVVKDED